MKANPGNVINRVLDEILDVLARWGEVTITSHFGGKTFQVRVQDADDTARAARPAARGRDGARPDADQVFALIAAKPVGLGLEDIAAALDVRPRNKLKPVIADLARSGRVIKVGRRFRSSSAVVRRGRVPNSAKRRGAAVRQAKAERAAPAKMAPAKPAKRRGRKARAAKAAAPKQPAGRPAKGRPARGTERAAESANKGELAEGPVIKSRTRGGKKTRVVKNSRSGMRRARLADGAVQSETSAPVDFTAGGSKDRVE